MTQAEQVLSERLKAMLETLRTWKGPMTAAEVAAYVGVKGSHETCRRRVREVAAYGREKGHRICAGTLGGTCGYWLARSPLEWAEYLESVKTGARFRFASVNRNQKAVVERFAGQGRLL